MWSNNIFIWLQPRRKDHLISTTPYHPSFSPKPQGRRSPERTHHSTRNNPSEPAPNAALTPSRRGFEDSSKRWRSRRERYTSDEELTSDEEEEEEEEELKLLQKKGSKHRPEPALAGRRHRKLQHKADGCVWVINTLFLCCIRVIPGDDLRCCTWACHFNLVDLYFY